MLRTSGDGVFLGLVDCAELFCFVAFAGCVKQGASRTSGEEGLLGLVDCAELFVSACDLAWRFLLCIVGCVSLYVFRFNVFCSNFAS